MLQSAPYQQASVSMPTKITKAILGQWKQNLIQPFYQKLQRLNSLRAKVRNLLKRMQKKTNSVLASLQSLVLPEAKWQKASIDFVTDLLTKGDTKDSIITMVDCVTKMVHLILCKKTTTAGEAAQLYSQHIVKLHRVPRAIHTD